MEEIQPGVQALIKTAKHGFTTFHGWDYQRVTVTRTTKTLVMVKASPDHVERSFKKDGLREFSSSERHSRRAELVLEPAAIAKALEQEAAEKARRALNGRAHSAVASLTELFHPYHGLDARTDEDLTELIAFADRMAAKVKARQAGG